MVLVREGRSVTSSLRYTDSVLYVTWATLGTTSRDGAEVYLANRYSPLVGDRHRVGDADRSELALGLT